MQTVNKLIEQLQELQRQGYGDLPCIYSIDDEGNAYHSIYSEPELLEVDNLEERYLELVWEDDGETPGINYNCVIIN